MKLQYLGHSCFRIISEMGTTVVTDPYKSSMVGFEMANVRCDVVTVSHHHADHDCTDNIAGNPPIVDEQISCAADDIAVQSFATFHDAERGAKRGANLVFAFVVDGLRIVHMGDIGCFDEEIARRIFACDVLMIPVGGTFTVDAQGAKQWVDSVQPKIVVPMHYRTAEHSFAIDGADKFVAMFPQKDVVMGGDSLVLDDQPQNDRTKVVVLQRFYE